MPNRKLKERYLDALYRTTHFSKRAGRLTSRLEFSSYRGLCNASGIANTLLSHKGTRTWVTNAEHNTRDELEALYSMYRKLVVAAQAAAPATALGHPPKIEGIDQSTFRDVMHNTFDLVTDEAILERMWVTWERGAVGGEGALKFEAWVRGLSVLLRGTNEERRNLCFAVYDLNSDGYITKDEMFMLLKNSLLKQPGDEDPDEGVRDLVELVLKKMDIDKDGRVSPEDYKEAVEQEPLLLEAFGQCLPSKRHAAAFLKNLCMKK